MKRVKIHDFKDTEDGLRYSIHPSFSHDAWTDIFITDFKHQLKYTITDDVTDLDDERVLWGVNKARKRLKESEGK